MSLLHTNSYLSFGIGLPFFAFVLLYACNEENIMGPIAEDALPPYEIIDLTLGTPSTEIEDRNRIGPRSNRQVLSTNTYDYGYFTEVITGAREAHQAGWSGENVAIAIIDFYFGTAADITVVSHGTTVMATAQAIARNADFIALHRSNYENNYDFLATNYFINNHSYAFILSEEEVTNAFSNFTRPVYKAYASTVHVYGAGNDSNPSEDRTPAEAPEAANVNGLIFNLYWNRYHHEVSGVIVAGSIDERSDTLSSNSFRAGEMSNCFLVTYAASNAGTSFAAPVVSGAAALLKQKYPHLTANAISYILLNTTDDLGPPGTDAIYGRGKLNIKKALDFSQERL